MELTGSEQKILDRFAQKCHTAGGPRAGFVLRKRAVCYFAGDDPELDFEAGLRSLVERDLLKVNEGGDLYYLTAAGAEALGGG